MRGRPQAVPGVSLFSTPLSYCNANKKLISEKNFSHEAASKHSY